MLGIGTARHSGDAGHSAPWAQSVDCRCQRVRVLTEKDGANAGAPPSSPTAPRRLRTAPRAASILRCNTARLRCNTAASAASASRARCFSRLQPPLRTGHGGTLTANAATLTTAAAACGRRRRRGRRRWRILSRRRQRGGVLLPRERRRVTEIDTDCRHPRPRMGEARPSVCRSVPPQRIGSAVVPSHGARAPVPAVSRHADPEHHVMSFACEVRGWQAHLDRASRRRAATAAAAAAAARRRGGWQVPCPWRDGEGRRGFA